MDVIGGDRASPESGLLTGCTCHQFKVGVLTRSPPSPRDSTLETELSFIFSKFLANKAKGVKDSRLRHLPTFHKITTQPCGEGEKRRGCRQILFLPFKSNSRCVIHGNSIDLVVSLRTQFEFSQSSILNLHIAIIIPCSLAASAAESRCCIICIHSLACFYCLYLGGTLYA